MEDLARGERIKTLREERHLKQPAVIDLLERKAGAKVVGLRGYQLWEAGGGIKWENVTLLADVFGVEPEWIMTGADRSAPATPDLVQTFNGDEPSQLDRIESKLNTLLEHFGLTEVAEDPLKAAAQAATRAARTARGERDRRSGDRRRKDDRAAEG